MVGVIMDELRTSMMDMSFSLSSQESIAAISKTEIHTDDRDYCTYRKSFLFNTTQQKTAIYENGAFVEALWRGVAIRSLHIHAQTLRHKFYPFFVLFNQLILKA